MKKENQESRISEAERFYLDTYGYAQLAATREDKLIPGMRKMYNLFLGDDDPLINKTLYEANMAKSHIRKKQEYDATPEDKRGEAKDPGQIEKHLENSFKIVYEATMMYAQKRVGMLSNLTCPQALDYYSNKEGKIIIETPNNIKQAILENSKIIKELEESAKDSQIKNSLLVIDHYKIQGILNSNIEKEIAKQRLEMASENLENLVK